MRVLVAGATGVVGLAAVKCFAESGADVVAISRRRIDLPNVTSLSVDLADRATCAAVFGAMSDVTHVVYAALYEKPGLFAGWREADQMERNLAMLQNLLDPLLAASPGLRHVSLLQGTKAYGAHVEPMKLPGREREPRHSHENFYWLQEDYLRAVQAGTSWHFTIWRPQIIFGEAFGSNMNPIPAIGVYASLLRAAGEPLHWPGGVNTVTEAVDADLLARAVRWAATDGPPRNETYNITNGDVFVMRNMWPAIAESFGMEVGDERPMALSEEMPKRQGEWTALHGRHQLRSPESLTEFVGQSFLYADMVLGYGRTAPGNPSLLSTVKLRTDGFSECFDTEDMFRKWFTYFRKQRLLPD